MSRLDERLWERCIVLLEKDKRRVSSSMRDAVLNTAKPFSDDGVYKQVLYDLTVCSLWDACAMWVQDSSVALWNFYPKIKEVVSKLVNAAEEGKLIFS